MGIARIFQRGGHTDSYIGYSPNCHLNIVGCLLTKRLTKGGHGHPRTPTGYALVYGTVYCVAQGDSNLTLKSLDETLAYPFQ